MHQEPASDVQHCFSCHSLPNGKFSYLSEDIMDHKRHTRNICRETDLSLGWILWNYSREKLGRTWYIFCVRGEGKGKKFHLLSGEKHPTRVEWFTDLVAWGWSLGTRINEKCIRCLGFGLHKEAQTLIFNNTVRLKSLNTIILSYLASMRIFLLFISTPPCILNSLF